MAVLRKQNPVDYKLLTIVCAILILGLAILYSASTVLSFSKFHTNSHYFFSQLVQGVLIGGILMYVCSKIDYHKWQKFAPLILFAAIVLLMAVLVVGFRVGNAKRWIIVGPVSVQPAEFAKLALIFYIASWVDKRKNEISNFYYGVIPALVILGLVAGLIILEPDMGTMLVVAAIGVSMLFAGGIRVRHLAGLVLLALVMVGALIAVQPYRLQRLETYFNTKADPQGSGYQINQALLAVGSGGFFGLGYGNSRQKYNYLPEVMGDSIFAITVEELGFLRAALIIVLYVLFAFRGFKVADGAPDTFGRMLAVGIVTWIIFQALINTGAITGLLPLTGIPLPFISYGSSSLIVLMAAVGILLNVSKQASI